MSLLASALRATHHHNHHHLFTTTTNLPPSSDIPLPSPTISSCDSENQFTDPSSPPNQHLAVLLPKSLWKPDSRALYCDNFFCRAKFSLLARRHHCRKCGGVFCHPCSSRSTPLLDTAHLSFVHPPRNVPLSTFVSPASPLVPARVCDDCWEQIHGLPPSHARTAAAGTPSTTSPSSGSSSAEHPFAHAAHSDDARSSSPSSPILTPPDGHALPLTRRVAARTGSISSGSGSGHSTGRHSPGTGPPTRQPVLPRCHSYSHTLPTSHAYAYAHAQAHATDADADAHTLGALAAYPLRRASAICKASGGGRWAPQPAVRDPAARVPVPGGKAPFEIEMEREEMEERRRRANPIVRDGAFQYRFPREPDPPVVTNWDHLSTF